MLFTVFKNRIKKMNIMEQDMEKHRRVIIRELILIASNSGLRTPKEILALTWGDIKLRKQEMEGMYPTRDHHGRFASILLSW